MKRYAFLDLEGVLYPELWEIYAHAFTLPELAKTTREEPDYAKLVRARIALLKENNIKLKDLSAASAGVRPLPQAVGFVRQLLGLGFHISVVTDAFQEIIGAGLDDLGISDIHPNHFACNTEGFITHALYARQTGKHETLQKILPPQAAYSIAVGDTFNDFSMLAYADQGFLFRPSESALQHADASFHVVTEYQQIIDNIKII